jgi:hypothetical protein
MTQGGRGWEYCSQSSICSADQYLNEFDRIARQESNQLSRIAYPKDRPTNMYD